MPKVSSAPHPQRMCSSSEPPPAEPGHPEACSYPQWHALFSRHAWRTCLLPLPAAFVDYLLADGVYVGEQSKAVSVACNHAPSFSLRMIPALYACPLAHSFPVAVAAEAAAAHQRQRMRRAVSLIRRRPQIGLRHFPSCSRPSLIQLQSWEVRQVAAAAKEWGTLAEQTSWLKQASCPCSGCAQTELELPHRRHMGQSYLFSGLC